jgi:sugar phosphate isomerase/epimerase
MSVEYSRRNFLKTGLAATCAAAIPSMSTSSAPRNRGNYPVLLGGPSFSNAADPEEIAVAHRKLGYSAAYCPALPLSESDKIRAFRDAFAKHNVVFAEVGRWVNLLDADPAKRAENLAAVTDGLALAEALGARCCVDIAGSYNPISWFGPHPDNFSRKHFDASVENARNIIDAVKPSRAKFCYEMMGWAHPHDVETCLKLIKAVDRKAFGAHLDPCNLVNSPGKFYDTTTLLNACFDKLGRWIVSCHAKDLTWDVEMNLHFREVAPGKGALDYQTYLKRLSELPQQPPLMIEHLANAEEYAAGRDHILKIGKEAGIQFG